MCEFVNFSIAKKLKEKGFKEKCYAYYTPHDATLFYNTNNFRGSIVDDCLYSYNSLDEKTAISKFIDAPTISQVLKWLREEKGHHVCIGYDGIYSYDIVRISDCEFQGADDGYASYESAALFCIEYIIDNLI